MISQICGLHIFYPTYSLSFHNIIKKIFTDVLILIKCNLSTILTDCGFGSNLRPIDLSSDPEGFA